MTRLSEVRMILTFSTTQAYWNFLSGYTVKISNFVLGTFFTGNNNRSFAWMAVIIFDFKMTANEFLSFKFKSFLCWDVMKQATEWELEGWQREYFRGYLH